MGECTTLSPPQSAVFLLNIREEKANIFPAMATGLNPALGPSPPAPEEWPDDLEVIANVSPASQSEEGASFEPRPAPGPHLNWLFVDLNSYFASVEQQDRPELRGRPVAVVPMMADTTCCIAASYEAKTYGVRTGTIVADAKRLCPDIVLVEARHEIYVEYHHRIVEAVESCLPVTAVLSIDEMACRLMGRERPLLAALELGRKVKARIQEQAGPMLRSSVGLATNRYLAKVASDMEKPDGLVALTLDVLPEALRRLSLRDLPGIGARTEKRLNEKGIHSMDDLLAMGSEQTGQLWGSVWGERLWHWLKGEDFDMTRDGPSEVDQPFCTYWHRRCEPRRRHGLLRTSCCTRRPCGCGRTSCGPAASAWQWASACRGGRTRR